MNRDLLNASVATGGGGGGGAQNRYGNVAVATIDIEDIEDNEFAGDFQVDEHEEEGISKERVMHFSNQKPSQNNIVDINSSQAYSRGSMAKDRIFSGFNNNGVAMVSASHQKTSSLTNGPLQKLGTPQQ